MKARSVVWAVSTIISLLIGCASDSGGITTTPKVKDAEMDEPVSDSSIDHRPETNITAIDARTLVSVVDMTVEAPNDAGSVQVKYDLAPDLVIAADSSSAAVIALDAAEDLKRDAGAVIDAAPAVISSDAQNNDSLIIATDAGQDGREVGDTVTIVRIIADAARDMTSTDASPWGPEVLPLTPDALIVKTDALIPAPDVALDTIASAPDSAPDLSPETIPDATLDTVPVCATGIFCNNVCADTANDPTNCGGCGNACPSGNACYGGVCSCYYVVPEAVYGNDHEIHIFCADTHFASVVITNGAIGGPYSVVLRGHPGVDVNGWGPGHHLGAFLSSGDSIETIKPPVTATATADGVTVVASGQVNRDVGGPYGTWDTSITILFDQAAKQIAGNGSYHVALPGSLTAAGEDLNLGRMSSNYLTDVPLQCGGFGNTGDTSIVEIERVGLSTAAWDFIDYPASCPTEPSTNMAIDAYGNCNDVDTAAMGLTVNTIASVYKPGLRVNFESLDGTQIMTFCGSYAEGYVETDCPGYDVSRCPFADNLGMEHIVKAGNETGTDLNFVLTSLSYAMSGDGATSCCPN